MLNVKNYVILLFCVCTLSVCGQNHLEFGGDTIFIDETFHIENGYSPIYFDNIISDSIRILNVRSAYGGMLPIWNTEIIPPGQEDSIRVQIDILNEECRNRVLTFLTENLRTAQTDITRITVSWLCEEISSTNEFEESQIMVFPNPASEFINFEDQGMMSRYELLSYDGRLKQSGPISARIYLSESLTRGVYILLLYNGNNQIDSRRIVISE